ncbi:PAP2 superfamily protein [Trichoderma reesei RUT C-30]|uniref:PAP2 superfamily protein n=1 Tax=Hypocrea jecorina (strain ATCC 56765 / BCRC 32924 / NRRL 11460 / Rut C-30) TaxID=1344414 RepID=A0A024RX94_HYPJR|nr:PAP2 superfamily protein [Trichoderma reesei RUT C-30]
MPSVRTANGRDSIASMGPLARFWKTTHAPDYVGLTILLAAWILIIVFVNPFHRMFFINDLRISYPHAEHERVTVPLNFLYALFIPLGILIAYNTITRASTHKHEATYLSLAISIVLASFLTDVVKNAVGRPRPDLLARCQPHADTKPNVLVDISVCTASDGHVLQDGWRSFPSGHSSFSFAGLGFLSLFLAGQLHVFNYPSGGRDLSRALLCLAPLLGAALIAISRCEDYRHDVYDVCIGSALGMTVAYWSYRRHFPRLSGPKCHEPHPHPADEAVQAGWQRVRDEEEQGSELAFSPGVRRY